VTILIFGHSLYLRPAPPFVSVQGSPPPFFFGLFFSPSLLYQRASSPISPCSHPLSLFSGRSAYFSEGVAHAVELAFPFFFFPCPTTPPLFVFLDPLFLLDGFLVLFPPFVRISPRGIVCAQTGPRRWAVVLPRFQSDLYLPMDPFLFSFFFVDDLLSAASPTPPSFPSGLVISCFAFLDTYFSCNAVLMLGFFRTLLFLGPLIALLSVSQLPLCSTDSL